MRLVRKPKPCAHCAQLRATGITCEDVAAVQNAVRDMIEYSAPFPTLDRRVQNARTRYTHEQDVADRAIADWEAQR